ncbi:TPR end-of-group domain-containing protein [Flexithrix dorotheae]|uniref:TPR end-of-group domain-containing protein n=1 Tax=Flexithrix dorotheae TaxID=70993 RepID=UPI000365582A|nr:hypothetical protein [Flexithrix dorotheae]
MGQAIILILFFLNNVNLLFSQETSCGDEIHRKAIDLYYEGKYDEALIEIEKTLNCGLYYYNYDAACIAAKSGKKEKAFMYLQNAIKLGWANMDHLKDDSDLKSLKMDSRWNSLDSLKENSFENIKNEINRIIEKCSNHLLIPYKENGKWGYLNQISYQRETEAIFLTAGFLNPKTTIVFGQYYFYVSCKNGITRILEDPIFSETYYEDFYKIDSTLASGFSVESNNYRTNNYFYSSIYKKFKGHSIKDRFLGIVQNNDGFSLIDEQGGVINNIEKLKEIKFHNFGTDSKSDLYPVNDINGDFIIFFVDENDNLGYLDKNFDTKLLTDKSDLSLPYSYTYKSSKYPKNVLNFIFIKRNNKVGIWECSTKDWVIKPQFEKVTKVYNLSEKEDELIFFLVEKNGEEYFINNKGKAFLPKPKK